MNLRKSPYFEPDTYRDKVTCFYCGLLNTADEKDIKCRYQDIESGILEWYIACRACRRFILLENRIYTLVQERLLQREHCFQFGHRCVNSTLLVFIDNVHEKCGKHKDCWLYLCKKCAETIHISHIHKYSRERLKADKKGPDTLITSEKSDDEEVKEDKPLLSAADKC